MTTTEQQRGAALGRATIHETCFKCGIAFAMPEPFYRVKLNDHTSFWCPNGHEQHYVPGKTREQLLKEQVDRERRRGDRWRDEAEAEARSHSATKGHLTRAKRRVAHGVCPCCNRHFQNLQDHMEDEHPDYDPTQDS